MQYYLTFTHIGLTLDGDLKMDAKPSQSDVSSGSRNFGEGVGQET